MAVVTAARTVYNAVSSANVLSSSQEAIKWILEGSCFYQWSREEAELSKNYIMEARMETNSSEICRNQGTWSSPLTKTYSLRISKVCNVLFIILVILSFVSSCNGDLPIGNQPTFDRPVDGLIHSGNFFPKIIYWRGIRSSPGTFRFAFVFFGLGALFTMFVIPFAPRILKRAIVTYVSSTLTIVLIFSHLTTATLSELATAYLIGLCAIQMQVDMVRQLALWEDWDKKSAMESVINSIVQLFAIAFLPVSAVFSLSLLDSYHPLMVLNLAYTCSFLIIAILVVIVAFCRPPPSPPPLKGSSPSSPTSLARSDQPPAPTARPPSGGDISRQYQTPPSRQRPADHAPHRARMIPRAPITGPINSNLPLKQPAAVQIPHAPISPNHSVFGDPDVEKRKWQKQHRCMNLVMRSIGSVGSLAHMFFVVWAFLIARRVEGVTWTCSTCTLASPALH